ncbi:GNAT family N-acetyltransferase [Candidatus Peregrinibacteria bacterium]|nr:GNAT family N-acetyltransferase [Candidatus Peregrinibacteria bacterium]
MKEINSENLEIKKAKKGDFRQIFRLLKQLWPQKDLSQKKLLPQYKKQLKYLTKIFFVLILCKKIVGLFSLTVKSNKTLYVPELVVDEKHRGHGIGKAAMAFIASYAIINNFKKLQLHSRPKRKEAHNLYTKLGFKKTFSIFKMSWCFTKNLEQKRTIAALKEARL